MARGTDQVFIHILLRAVVQISIGERDFRYFRFHWWGPKKKNPKKPKTPPQKKNKEVLQISLVNSFHWCGPKIIQMKRGIPQWEEPAPEQALPRFANRSIPQWQEPPPEEDTLFKRAIFSFRKPTPKPAAHPLMKLTQNSASQYHSEKSAMPNFRRNRNFTATTTAEITDKKQQETYLLWIQLIFSMATYSNLYTSTTSSSYQELHLQASIKNFNSDGVKRHVQIWNQFEDWCKPLGILGIHPAGISIQFLLDFLYESSQGINKTRINIPS